MKLKSAKKLTLLVVFFFLGSTLLAQWIWNAKQNGNSKEENAHHIDYDNAGNVYTYSTDLILRKYNSAGVLQWSYTHSATLNTLIAYSDFAVKKSTGEVYLALGYAGLGSQLTKISTSGTFIGTFAPVSDMWEIWRLDFTNNEVLVAHGGGTRNKMYQYSVFAPDLSYTGVWCCILSQHDIVISTVDDNYSYMLLAKTWDWFGDTALANTLIKSPLSPVGVPVWSIKTDYDFLEENIYQYRGYSTLGSYEGVGYNGMTQTVNYLFLYDGVIIRKYDKNGNFITSRTVGTYPYSYAGIDACNKWTSDGEIYVGVGKQVQVYDNNLNLIRTIPVQDTVYDVAVSNNHIYVAGNHFVQSIQNVCSSTGTLPIELTYFKAQLNKDKVILSWQTQTETNNEKFIIYRRPELGYWQTIGEIKGAGNNYTELNYLFVDWDPPDGTDFYILVQKDYDGHTTESKMVYVNVMQGEAIWYDVWGRIVNKDYFEKIK